MSTKQTTNMGHVDEDYIEMELSSSSNFFSYSIDSPPKSREFEFQMTCVSNEKDSKTTPADDLFYKGKLLPLHLPPRLQMVQNLLENPNLEEDTTFLFNTSTFASYIPLESCNISSSESCRVSSSSEVNHDEFSFGFVSDVPKKHSWHKKLKQMNHFLFCQTLKSSKTYLKSLFNKSGCSDKTSCASDANKVVFGRKNKNPFEIVYDNKKQLNIEDDFINHRKSFSGIVQRHCGGNKSSSLSTSSSGSSSTSSSFSFSSAGYYDLQLFKRSISANYELECSVEGAIAHCKQSQSQQQCCSKNGEDDGTICSQFGSKVEICGDKENEKQQHFPVSEV